LLDVRHTLLLLNLFPGFRKGTRKNERTLLSTCWIAVSVILSAKGTTSSIVRIPVERKLAKPVNVKQHRKHGNLRPHLSHMVISLSHVRSHTPPSLSLTLSHTPSLWTMKLMGVVNHTHKHTHTRARARKLKIVYTSSPFTFVLARTQPHTHTNTHTTTQTHTHTYTRTQTHIHIHTHTHRGTL